MASGMGFLSTEAMAGGREGSAGSGGEEGAADREGARVLSQHRNSQPVVTERVVPERARMWKARREREVEELRRLTTQDVASYVSLCGDTNPIHTCDSAAQSAGFQGHVVQGMLYAGLFPAIIGSHFDGAVYVSQMLNFKSPVLVGEALCAEVEVIAVKKLRHHYRLSITDTSWSRLKLRKI